MNRSRFDLDQNCRSKWPFSFVEQRDATFRIEYGSPELSIIKYQHDFVVSSTSSRFLARTLAGKCGLARSGNKTFEGLNEGIKIWCFYLCLGLLVFPC